MHARTLSRALVLSIAATAVASAWAGPVKLAPTSSITIEGDSTLHRYQLRATRIDAAFEVDPQEPSSLSEALRKGAVRSAEVTVAVGAFTSGESRLDENMRKALHASKTPFIKFRLTSYDIAPPGKAAGATAEGFELVLHGVLTVAGGDKQVAVPAHASTSPSGLAVTGVLPLRMTDFKVDPPVLMLGTIRCKDEVSVRFELDLPAR